VPPAKRPRAHIIEPSARSVVSVDRLGQKHFQLVVERVGRLQLFQPRRQPIPRSWCGDREGSVADSSTSARYDKVATCQHAVHVVFVHWRLVSVGLRCTPVPSVIDVDDCVTHTSSTRSSISDLV